MIGNYVSYYHYHQHITQLYVSDKFSEFLHSRSLRFGFKKVSGVNTVCTMQQTALTASHSVTVQYLSQLLTQVKHLRKSAMPNFFTELFNVSYRMPINPAGGVLLKHGIKICVSYRSILE